MGVQHLATPTKGAKEDEREYEVVQLQNGMRVLLASDSNADKAACAVDVKCGSLCDGWEVPGLAHLLEHMLFFSSNKYPEEDAYRQFVTQHGGSTNAFTASLDTCFFFDIKPTGSAFEQSLDRFASFLTHPTFASHGVEREMHAVNNEAERNVSSEMWRQIQVVKQFIQPDHPLHRFAVGNLQTLSTKEINVHQRLIDLHQSEYGAERMTAVLYGQHTLQTLRELAETNFANVPQSAKQSRPMFEAKDVLLTDSFVEVVPTTAESTLEFIWQINPQVPHYRCDSAGYISHLLGHESQGSPYYYLHKNNLITDLFAGLYPLTYDDATFFKVSVRLTEKGKHNLDLIGSAIFGYINILQTNGPEKWIWDEQARIAALSFDYKPRPDASSFAVSAAETLQYAASTEVLQAEGNVPLEFDPAQIQKDLECLTVDSALVLFADADADSTTDDWQTEQHFGAQYRSIPKPEYTLSAWRSPPKELYEEIHLPKPNVYLPERFDIRETHDCQTMSNTPELVQSDELLTAYWKPDLRFNYAPQLSINIDLRHTNALSAQAYEYTRLIVAMTLRLINSEHYQAQCAGLSASIDDTSLGIVLSLRAKFSDKIEKLLDLVLTALYQAVMEPPVDFEADFEDLRSREEENLLNRRKEHSYERALYLHSLVTTENKLDFESLILAVSAATFSGMCAFGAEFLRTLGITVHVSGNATKTEAQSIAQDVHTRFRSQIGTVAPRMALCLPRGVLLPKGNASVEEVHESEVEENSACLVSFQIPSSLATFLRSNEHIGVLCELLSRCLREPAFAQLRTQEQLGYIVATLASSKNASKAHYFVTLVQSSEYTADYLQERILTFLHHSARKSLVHTSNADFEDTKAGLEAVKAEQPKDVLQEASEQWKEIYDGTKVFNRREREISILRAITKDDLIAFFDHCVLGSDRRQINVRVRSKKHQQRDAHAAPEDALTRQDLPRFRASQYLLPTV